MALTDFTFYTTEAGQEVALTSTNPILGTSSLRVRRHTATGTNLACNGLRAAPAERGFVRGRLRTALRLETHTGTIDHGLGLLCMQSQTNLSSGAGSAYGLMLRTSTTGGLIDSLRLLRYTAGLAAPTSNILASYAVNLALGTTVCLALEWRFDPGRNEIRLTGYFSPTFTFPTQPILPQVLTTVVTSGALSTSVGEGVGIFINGAGDHASVFGETAYFGLV